MLDAAGHPVATGELIKGADGGMATWADVKQQAAEILGIDLTDLDVGRVPLVLTDEYGKFMPGANGLPQLVAMAGGVLEGDLTTLPPTLASAALAVPTGHAFIIDIAHSANPRSSTGVPLPADGDSAPGLANPVVLSNASFEANSMADGQPDVNVDPVLGNWALIDPQGWDVTGFAGVYAPTAAVVSATGHQGGNVVFLDGGATLVRNTGVLLQEGNAYTLTFNVGNRLDQETFVGGTAQFVTVDGDVLATVTLPTPVDGNWAAVTLSTGPIAQAQAGEELRIEIIHAGASGSQVLIDNVQFRAEYDDELLDAHLMAGDGRVNENIALTAVHHVFHSEHNRLVEHIKRSSCSPTGDSGIPRPVAPGTPAPSSDVPTGYPGTRMERRTPVPGGPLRHRDAVPASRVRRIRAQGAAERRRIPGTWL